MRRWMKVALGAGAVWTAGCGGSTTPDPSTVSETPAPIPNAGGTQPATESDGLRPVPAAAEVDQAALDSDTAAARDAFQRLLVAAENNRPDDWVAAEEQLKNLGAAIVPALIPALEGDQSLAREMAVMFLAQLGPDAAPAAGALAKLLDDPSPFVQVNAASVLTTLEDPPAAAIQTLVTLLEHPENNLRITAINALGNVPAAGDAAVAALAGCLSDADPIVRQAAAATLGRVGSGAKSALPQLRTLLTDADPAVKEAALFAIRALDPAVVGGDGTAVNTSAEQDRIAE